MPKVNSRQSMKQVPARTAESDAMSRDLKRRRFNFVGSIISYAFMQAVGMVNDHCIDCFRYKQLLHTVSSTTTTVPTKIPVG
jgi:DNA-3-methyladenine glycosylase I